MAGWVMAKKRTRYTPAQKAAALDLFRKGSSPTQVSAVLGIPYGTLKHWRRIAGLSPSAEGDGGGDKRGDKGAEARPQRRPDGRYLKGYSGNPGGQSTLSKDFRRTAQQNAYKAQQHYARVLEVLTDPASTEEQKEQVVQNIEIITQIGEASARWGFSLPKATKAIEHSGPNGEAIEQHTTSTTHHAFTTDHLAEVGAILAQSGALDTVFGQSDDAEDE